MRQFFFLRHGQTDFNKNNLWTGASDVPLNAEGESQIAALIEKVKGLDITHIYTSPLLRATRTAEIVNQAFNALIIVDERLSERSFGLLEGTTKTIDSRRCLDITKSVENKNNFLKRVERSICSIQLNAHVLIVSHSGVFKALIELGVKAASDQVRNGEIISLSAPDFTD